MVIETASQVKMHRYCVVQNVPLLLTLLEFISELKGTLQVWFARKIHEICVQSSLSALKCSLDGVTLKLLNVVESVQDGRLELEKESLEAIFKILEFFGRHSISALELKQLIALVRATQEGKQPPYSARLVSSEVSKYVYTHQCSPRELSMNIGSCSFFLRHIVLFQLISLRFTGKSADTPSEQVAFIQLSSDMLLISMA